MKKLRDDRIERLVGFARLLRTINKPVTVKELSRITKHTPTVIYRILKDLEDNHIVDNVSDTVLKYVLCEDYKHSDKMLLSRLSN
jgi:predicted transcriptional regulator